MSNYLVASCSSNALVDNPKRGTSLDAYDCRAKPTLHLCVLFDMPRSSSFAQKSSKRGVSQPEVLAPDCGLLKPNSVLRRLALRLVVSMRASA